MFDPNNLFHSILLIPILNALMAFYKFFLFVKLPGALGFALIALTVLIRLMISPLMATSLKNSAKLTKLKPKLDELTKKHKNDKQALFAAQAALYKEAGINPTAGCLPMLLQMPLLIAIYNLFLEILTKTGEANFVEGINKVLYFPALYIDRLNLDFLGMDLSVKPNQWQTVGFWILSIPVITGVLQYFQTKLMIPSPGKDVIKKEETKDESKKEDTQAMIQKQMAIMMPLMIGFFAYSFPLGLSLYWNTFTVFGIIQQYKINKES